MNNYKKTKALSLADAAYLAGLVDGEGTVTLVRKHRNEYRQLGLFVSSTEKVLLNFVKTATGVGKITTKKIAESHHSQSFTYAVYNRQALVLLEQIHPFLKSYKKKRAALILKHYLDLTPRNGKYSEELLLKKRDFENRILNTKATG